MPGALVLLGAWAYATYLSSGMTAQARHASCDVCPEDGYFTLGLVLGLAGIVPSIVLFVGGGADRDRERSEGEAE